MRSTTAAGRLAAPLAIIMAIFAILVYTAVTRGSSTVQANRSKLYEQVMALDPVSDYPQSPDSVLAMYCLIDRFLSGNTAEDFSKEDLRTLVEKQRVLLHGELLALNPLEAQIEGYEEKIEYLRENNLRLMQINTETPRFSDDAQMSSIGAKQFWTQSINVDLIYNLKREGDTDRWKIIGWYVNEQVEAQ